MRVANYDPKGVTFAWLGKEIKGFAEGTMITITPNSDLLTYTIGAQGDVAKSVSANRSATLSCTLMKNCSTNAWLHGLITSVIEGGEGAEWPEGNAVVKDRTSPTIPFLKNACLHKRPTHEWGDTAGTVTWEWFVEEYSEIPNSDESASILSQAINAAATFGNFQQFVKGL